MNSIVGPLTFGWKGWVGDRVGYSVLMGFAAVMAALGGFSTAFRDGSGRAGRHGRPRPGHRRNPPVLTPVGLSYWPMAGAFISRCPWSAWRSTRPCSGWASCCSPSSWSPGPSGRGPSGPPAAGRRDCPRPDGPARGAGPGGADPGRHRPVHLRLLLAIREVAVYLIIMAAIIVFVMAFILASRPERQDGGGLRAGRRRGHHRRRIAGGVAGERTRCGRPPPSGRFGCRERGGGYSHPARR